ncbi:hypothetical protein D3C76_1539140 [compost metagenome]
MEISEVAGLKDGEVVLNPLYEFQESGEREGRVQGGLVSCGNPLMHTAKLRMAGVTSYPLSQAGF